MGSNLINASLSTQNVVFRPGTTPASFTVTVNNDSNQFANFQIEITAAGEQRNSEYHWYKLEPEVSAAKPPGSSTDFQVLIFNTPIPGFVGTVNLTVKIFSPQLGQERRLLLRLQIERNYQPTLLSVELPIREFQVYPCNSVNIPVRVKNLSQQSTNVVLRFVGVDSSWLIGSLERRFSLDPGGYTEVTFECEPPSVVQSPSQSYPFSIEATTNNGYPASATGNLEVLPVGFIKFHIPQKQQKIPSKNQLIPNWKADTAAFELSFKNASNLYQEIYINIQGRDWRKCSYKTIPKTANLHLGETSQFTLNVKTKRPWIGIAKTLQLEVRAELFDQRLGTTDPATQTIEIQSLPIIPLWLQATVLGLIALLLALLFKPEPIMHTRSVNSVDFSGTSLTVLSGSDDCTLRLWNITNKSLEPANIYYSQQSVACDRQQQPQGLLAIANDAVQVSRFIPVENNRVAIGLDSGVIELRKVPNGEKTAELLDQEDPKAKGDRVFDLAFTKNSLYLFSGYGSGKLRLWSRTSINNQFQPQPQVINLQTLLNLSGFQIRALTLSPDDQTLVIAGNFKRFLLSSFNANQTNNKLQNLSMQTLEKIDEKTSVTDYIWGVAFAPNSPGKILATSDSAGYITTWNLNQCQRVKNPNPQNGITTVDCEKLDSWQVSSKMPVQTLKFSEDGRFLVSGGDDGRVIVWYLTTDYKLDKTKAATGQTIYQSPKKIRSVDLKGNMIVSGDEDFQVQLHRIK